MLEDEAHEIMKVLCRTLAVGIGKILWTPETVVE